MTDPAPRIDFANLPAPTEGFLVTLFITVRKVARSRDFYSRVLGGTVVLDENPCIGPRRRRNRRGADPSPKSSRERLRGEVRADRPDRADRRP